MSLESRIMITPPTDNLYKFMSIFGLVVVFSSAAFWWSASNEYDQFFESNAEYVNSIFEGGKAYEKFAKKTNEGIAIYNSVAGDQSLLSEEQKKELDKILIESEKLSKEADAIINSNPATRIAMNTRTDKYDMAKYMSFSGIFIGVLVSVFGFYLWHTRLQKYIDQLHKSNSA